MAGFDVVIIGNGALGTSLAVELARRDARVAVVGRAHRPFGASPAAGAMLGCFGEVTPGLLATAAGRARFALDLAARRTWPGWLASLDAEDLVTARGTTVLLNAVGLSEIDSAGFAAIAAALDEHGEPWERVDPEDVAWLDPDPLARPLRALHIPGEHAVDAPALLARLTEEARRSGVDLVDAEAVGLVDGVRLDDGAVVEGDRVVLAAGVGTQRVLDTVAEVGARIPRLVSGYGVSVEIETVDGTAPEGVLRTPNRSFACGLHVLPRGSGRVYVGATNIISPDPVAAPVVRDLTFLLDCAHQQVRRDLYVSPVTAVRVGNRPVTLDGFPLLGETSVPGLWTMTGTYRDGFFLAPLLAGEFAARLAGEPGALDLTAFAPERPPLQSAREQVVADAVVHMLGTGYEHRWSLPADWQDFIATDIHPLYAMWADELDPDFTPPPELLATARQYPELVTMLRTYYDAWR